MEQKGYWKVNLKAGLGKPVFVYADDIDMAKKMGLAEFMRTNGHSETVDLFSNVGNTIESVELVA